MTRILMASHFPLFRQGIQALLCQETGLEVVGWESDVNRTIARIHDLQPDVVVLDSAEPSGVPPALVLSILSERSFIKIIELNLRDNTFCVLSQEQRRVGNLDDLIAAIKD